MGVNLIEKISVKEREMIKAYIENYAVRDNNPDTKRASFETIFTPWANEKGSLYKLLGDNLIISKSFTMDKGLDMLSDEMFKLLEESDFISQYKEILAKNLRIFSREFDILYYELITTNNLIEGYYNGQDFSLSLENCPKIEFRRGEKIMKVIHKIANAFDIPGFEEFRIEHSKILNKKKFNSEITLSIHPLDYMTMSDNGCNWESCMSWENDGCYKQGTVEMMNSPCVVVAYVNSSKDWNLFGYSNKDYTWSNKKWRCLFIVTDEIICKIKSYPYQNDAFEKAIVNWLSELAEENWGISYDAPIIGWNGYDKIQIPNSEERFFFQPETTYMYNDFDTGVTHWLRVNSKAIGSNPAYYLNYSGMSECMWCGKAVYCDQDEEGKLLCDQCLKIGYCYECDSAIYGNEIYTDDSGYQYCQCCFEEYTREEDITGNIYNCAEVKKLYVVPSYEIIKELKNKNSSGNLNTMGLSDYFNYCDCPYLTIREDILWKKEEFENSIFKKYFNFEDIHILYQSWHRFYIVGEDCFNNLYVYQNQAHKDRIKKNLIDYSYNLFDKWTEEK